MKEFILKIKSINFKKFILNNMWWISLSIALVMLILHTFKVQNIVVDTTSIILFAAILLSPFITSITKIKYGDFEAAIDPKEVEKIKTDVEKNQEERSEENHTGKTFETTNAILELSKTDPIIALAKTRIELEKVLTQIARALSIDEKNLPLGLLLRKLSNHEILSKQTSKALNEVISICNRAIHGESISQESSETIIELGIQLLEDLYFDLSLQISLGTKISENIIANAEVNKYYDDNKKFRLTTIIPFVDNPKKIIRELNQEQLDNLLVGYNEYAEFIVELVEL